MVSSYYVPSWEASDMVSSYYIPSGSLRYGLQLLHPLLGASDMVSSYYIPSWRALDMVSSYYIPSWGASDTVSSYSLPFYTWINKAVCLFTKETVLQTCCRCRRYRIIDCGPDGLTVYFQESVSDYPGSVARSEACPLGIQAAPSSIPTSGTFFHGDLVMKNFYGHSPSSADSRRAVVSYWRKNVH